MLVSRLYLKHADGPSDDEEVQRWAQDVLFQRFSAQQYFEHRLPSGSSLISRVHKDLDELGVEELLKTTIDQSTLMCSGTQG